MSDMDNYIDEYVKKAGWWRLICLRCKNKWYATWNTESKKITGSVKDCEICGKKNPTILIKIPVGK